MHEKRRDEILASWAAMISRRPRTIIGISLVIAAICTIYAATCLEFKSNRNELISPELSWNKRFIEWQNAFHGSHDLVVVVDTLPVGAGGDPKITAEDVVDRIGPLLDADELVEHVVWGFNTAQFSPKTVRMLPMDQFEQRLAEAEQAKLILENDSLSELVNSAMASMKESRNDTTRTSEQAVAEIESLTELVRIIGIGLNTPTDQPVELAESLIAQTQENAWQYLQSDNGRLLFIRVTPKAVEGELNALKPAIESIRATLQEVRSEFPQYEFGLTGIEVVEADETEAATTDSTKASIVASILISIVMIVAFHSVRGPVLAMVALLVGIAWSFGFVTIAIGHLQVLSVVFTVILLGLGIAYGIHLKSSFELARHDHDDSPEGFAETLKHTFRIAGPGIITGGVTTAGAFLTTVFTDFTGMAEMGIIASAGVILCLIAMFTVYPALLRIFKSRHKHFVPMDSRTVHFFEEAWIRPFTARPSATLIVAFILTAGSAYLVGNSMHFDYDLMKLQPTNAPGVKWAERIITDGGTSIYFGVSVADDIDDARKKVQAFRDQDGIDDQIGGAGLLFPMGEEEKLARLQELRADLQPLLDSVAEEKAEQEPGKNTLLSKLGGMQFAFQAALFTQMPEKVRAAILRASDQLAKTRSIGESLTEEQREARLARLEVAYDTFRQSVAQQLTQMTDISSLTFDDLPQELIRSYRDDQGRLALEISPVLELNQSPLDPVALPRFIDNLHQVDPNATGVVVQVYESGSLIKNSYMYAGIYALIIVFILLLFDFRSVHDALLALVPVAMGFTLTFGIMRLLDMSINPANIIVLPLMFGIGVDDGVHLIHRFRANPDDDPAGLTHGTGKGITITTMTTVIGFASMMLADHQGIKSLGFVLATGIGLTMFGCWFVMPCWLTLRRRWQQRKPATASA